METTHTTRVLSDDDIAGFMELITLFEDVFEMKDFVMPPEEHLQQLLKKSGFFAMVAEAEGKIVGGLTVYVFDQYYSTKPLAYIFDLAIDRKFQRKGIGSKLIEDVVRHCKSKGFQEVFVQADRVDDYALKFYRSTRPGMEEDVIHYTYPISD